MSAISDCKLRLSWANFQMSPDCFEIGIPKLPYKPMSCHAFIIHLNNPIIYVL